MTSRGARGEHLALVLRQWSDDVVLLGNGPLDLASDQLARLQARGIRIIETPVAALDGENGQLRRIRLEDGTELDRDALFCSSGGGCAPTWLGPSAVSCATTAPSS